MQITYFNIIVYLFNFFFYGELLSSFTLINYFIKFFFLLELNYNCIIIVNLYCILFINLLKLYKYISILVDDKI